MKIFINFVYAGLLSLPLSVCIVLTILFEMASVEQTNLSLRLGFYVAPIFLLRAVNWFLLFFHIMMVVGIFLPRPNWPAFSLGFAFFSLVWAFFSIFIGSEVILGGRRYRSAIEKFRIKTKYDRHSLNKLLPVLYDYQDKYACCGLNDYKDYQRADSDYNVPNAENDEEDQRDEVSTGLSFAEYIIFRSVYYTVKGKEKEHGCKRKRFKSLAGPNERLDESQEVPLSCCVKPMTMNCNEVIFSLTDVSKVAEKINVKGCFSKIIEPLNKFLRKELIITFFVYPWIVSIYSLIICWGYNRECFRRPIFWKKKKVSDPAPLRASSKSNAASLRAVSANKTGQDEKIPPKIETPKEEPNNKEETPSPKPPEIKKEVPKDEALAKADGGDKNKKTNQLNKPLVSAKKNSSSSSIKK